MQKLIIFSFLQSTKLHSQIAKLRSSVERGETTRQKLEYELALAHKAASQEKRGATERENQLQKTNSSQKEQINELNKKIQILEKDLGNTKQMSKNDDKKYRNLNADKVCNVYTL
jgi:chromosome segregation ATPase